MKRILKFCTIAVLLLVACTKEQTNAITGTWARPGVVYSFFDDSRFQQSDKPGEQWIWSQDGETVNLYGNPERVWRVVFLAADSVQVVEQADTFTIRRQ